MATKQIKSYKNYLFDWDGCLARTLAVWLTAYKVVFKQYKLAPTKNEIVTKMWGDWNGCKMFGIADPDEFNSKLTPVVNKGLAKVKLYPGAMEVLAALKRRGSRIALHTSNKREMLLPQLKRNRVIDYFDVILTAEDVAKHKPDPEMINKEVELLGGELSEFVVIGDSKGDLGAAKSAGVDSVLFYPDENKKFYNYDELMSYHPTYVISSFCEMLTN